MIKKIISYLVALTPGSVPFMLGDLKKTAIYLSVFILGGYLYRVSGLWGANVFFIGLLLLSILFLGITVFQIKNLKKAILNGSQLLKGFVFCLFTIVLVNSIFKYLSPGNLYTTASNESMAPLIPSFEYVYVTQLTHEFEFGDIVLYHFQENPFLGIICGLSGDSMSVQDLAIYRNSAVTDCGSKDFTRLLPTSMGEFKVPTDNYFIVKPNGLDSSFLNKTFSKNDIKGKVLFRIKDVPFSPLVKLFFIFVEH